MKRTGCSSTFIDMRNYHPSLIGRESQVHGTVSQAKDNSHGITLFRLRTIVMMWKSCYDLGVTVFRFSLQPHLFCTTIRWIPTSDFLGASHCHPWILILISIDSFFLFLDVRPVEAHRLLTEGFDTLSLKKGPVKLKMKLEAHSNQVVEV